jgi:hypothetical protein
VDLGAGALQRRITDTQRRVGVTTAGSNTGLATSAPPPPVIRRSPLAPPCPPPGQSARPFRGVCDRISHDMRRVDIGEFVNDLPSPSSGLHETGTSQNSKMLTHQRL